MMVRGVSIVLGVGLICLWLMGLAHHATSWLTWLVGAGALGAFSAAASLRPERTSLTALVGSPMAVGLGLVVIAIIGLSVAATVWVAWWAFAFGCAFLLLGLVAINGEQTTAPRWPRTV
jgi:hypothetical protein